MNGDKTFHIKIISTKNGKLVPFTKICKLTGWDEGKLRPVLWSDRFVLLEKVVE